MHLKTTLLLTTLFLLLFADSKLVLAQTDKILIKRTEKKLFLISRDNTVLLQTKIGIGRGGLKKKVNMSDFVTPTGMFQVDLILSTDSFFNSVSLEKVLQFKTHPTFSSFVVNDRERLARLFSNMNSLDFDSDGQADKAYGYAYIGLTSNESVTGPKMRFFKNTPYWYSIALHGTEYEEKDIGAANSGGCIHVPESILKTLLSRNLVQIGTQVEIKD